jgi:hypothetical protein
VEGCYECGDESSGSGATELANTPLLGHFHVLLESCVPYLLFLS